MNIQSFLEHHGINRNPFAEEDAQTDQVFKEYCISSAYHPIWDKVYGDPSEPSTSIIFGPKGSGKTAMRLQIDRHVSRYNEEHPGQRLFVIRYDDFNPYLDHFCERLGRRTSRKPERVLDAWRLWDHMDSILCLGVTDLIDRILHADQGAPSESVSKQRVHDLDRTSSRDMLLLASSYDQSTASTFLVRWNQLKRALGYRNFTSKLSLIAAIAAAILSVLLVVLLYRGDWSSADGDGAEKVSRYTLLLIPVITLMGSAPWIWRTAKCHLAAMGIRRHMRVGKRETGSLRKILQQFPSKDLANQPLPRYDRTDDRYELLNKFKSILERLGFSGIIVLMDRVDEPHMTGGKPELMRRFVWPLLDNKLLKHPGIGFKIMLPQELHRDIDRETREFHERARLDKQNVIPAFQWTGESLYDLARARMLACAAPGASPEPKDLFSQEVSYQRMLSAFQSLRVPRHLFRFLFRVQVEHCNRHTDAQPTYQISGETFESTLAVYARDAELNHL